MKSVVRLSAAQSKIWDALDPKEWKSAYELGVGLRTLDALHKKGLAHRKYEVGAFFTPRAATLYRKAYGVGPEKRK